MSASRTVQSRRVETITRRLIGIQSGPRYRTKEDFYKVGDIRMAISIASYFTQIGVKPSQLVMADGRLNVMAFLPSEGKSQDTLLLFGHIDTVGTDDYGDKLAPLATQPDKLKKALIAEGAEKKAIADLKTGDYLCGRGALDMKSGLAIEMGVIAQLKRRPVDGNIIFLGTPDEENDSAGMLQAVPFLRDFARTQGLNLVGAINADYVTERFANDPARYVYIGTIGKLLPSFYIVGKTTHVGEAYSGIDANLIAAELVRQIELNTRLCDNVDGEATLPPVTLKLKDLKESYNVQTPFTAWVYFNLFTHSRTPQEAMNLIYREAVIAAGKASTRLRDSRASYTRKFRQPAGGTDQEIKVVTFDELKRGLKIDPSVASSVTDPREKSRLIVEDLWERSGRLGPAIVTLLSPPYYPHGFVSPEEEAGSAFVRASKAVAESCGLTVRNFYPYISDNSFLRAPRAGAALHAFMPLWENGYSLPMKDILALNLPAVNIGPYGLDAHKRTERVLAPYSFGVVPKVMEAVIRQTFSK